MTGNEKFYRWLNAYLDGSLSDEQRNRFQALIDRDPTVRARVEIQRNIEDSMRRLFSPGNEIPTVAGRDTNHPAGSAFEIADETIEADSYETLAMPTESRSKSSTGGRAVRRLMALAAAIVLAAGSWVGWQVWSASERMAAFYESSKQKDFKEDWVCDDEQEFQTTFWYRVGSGVTLAEAKLPDDARMMGLKYHENPDELSVYLMGRVDGQGVIVRVERKENARFDYVFTKNLAGFRKETDHLTMIEITPLDKPYFLDALSETELPEAWKNEMKIPGSAPK